MPAAILCAVAIWELKRVRQRISGVQGLLAPRLRLEGSLLILITTAACVEFLA